MSYQAIVLQVMIASPNDVTDERQLAQEIILEWNAINSFQKKIILMPTSWETHSAPLMGDRPQAIINEQVLKNCDLLIGIFWTRIGTPTGESVSGTVEEIQEHISAGKPVMLYFSTAPVLLESVDQDQYQQLKQFKDKCLEKGLIGTFSDLAEFRKKFFRQIAITINTNEYLHKKVLLTNVTETPLSVTITDSPLPANANYELSKEACELLIEASQDKLGIIMVAKHSTGLFIKTNEKIFGDDNNRRSQALWEAAKDELVYNGFLKPRGFRGVVFEVTNAGYEVADKLRKPS